MYIFEAKKISLLAVPYKTYCVHCLFGKDEQKEFAPVLHSMDKKQSTSLNFCNVEQVSSSQPELDSVEPADGVNHITACLGDVGPTVTE